MVPLPSKYPPAKPEALGFEPLKAAGRFVAHAKFPFGPCAYERLCPTFASLSGKLGDFHRLNHFCHSPTFKISKPWHTPGSVKLLLPPQQNRGVLPFGIATSRYGAGSLVGNADTDPRRYLTVT